MPDATRVVRRPAAPVRFRPVLAAATVVFAVALAVSVTWLFLGMRAVMAVGGSCASGGPYVTAQSCPDGSGLIFAAVPVMIISALAGSACAVSTGAPNLLVPMWAFLFGACGWNFLEFAFTGPGVEVGWLVCGVMFVLMALPAVGVVLVAVWHAAVPPAGGSTTLRWWLPAYSLLGAVGVLVGAWSHAALS